ncbi:meiotic recombination protein REC8 homolog [Cheilinus undulatus]|uniref:meiotic recombination protein REC8 homolog n=1 Tax=Cheilinus undulatus TaxID=241271 RepID=UPI001BD4E034|nr:meiotic recombination protein REC8 homolog [Cheilinus undulatus]
MFYYPAVLRRHSGCFSTVWLVATKGIKITRRDFLKVNVKSTCDNIINYVLERVPPPLPDLPRPRFSLYLSSQLQYGIVVVFHRQCVIFLEELQSVVEQLAKQRTSQTIDMDEHSRLALDFPDALFLLEDTEGAQDPLFGEMLMQDEMPSPNSLIQMGQGFTRETSPDRLEQASLPTVVTVAALESDLTASPETITLREMEQVAIPVAEFEGVELLDDHPDTIDLLLAQTDYFPEGDVEIVREKATPGEQKREIERGKGEAALEGEGAETPTVSTLKLQPTTTLSTEEAMMESVERPGPPTDQVTPVSVPPLSSPLPAAGRQGRRRQEVEDVPPVGMKRRRRRRQLIFFDPETQIPQEVLQRQINNPQAETRPPSVPPPPSHMMISAAELFNKPCTFLLDEMQSLWKQAATITPLSGSDLQVGQRGSESTDSEMERQQAMLEEMEIEDEKPEFSPKEVPRDVSESELFDISAHGSLPLEASDQREMPHGVLPMYMSEREGLPELTEHDETPVLFQSLLPPEVDRRTVSNIFERLLGTLSTRKICAVQTEPYGDIWISPGPNYNETVLV